MDYLQEHGVDLKDIDISDREDLTQTTLCDDVDVSRNDDRDAGVEDELTKYNSDSKQQTLDEEDDVDEQRYVECRGEKTDGGDCGVTVKHESGYCHAHRAQWDRGERVLTRV